MKICHKLYRVRKSADLSTRKRRAWIHLIFGSKAAKIKRIINPHLYSKYLFKLLPTQYIYYFFANMENLSEQQYEAILHYMQKNNIESFQSARQQILQGHSLQSVPQNSHDANESEENTKIRSYLIKKMKNQQQSTPSCCFCLKRVCSRFAEKVIPELIKRRFFKSKFYNIYQDQSVIELKHQNLDECRIAAKKRGKYIFVLISNETKNHCIAEFLKKNRLLRKIEQKFEIVGVLESELRENCALENSRAPCIAIMRDKHYGELKIVRSFYDEKLIMGFDEEILEQVEQDAYNESFTETTRVRKVAGMLMERLRVNFQSDEEQIRTIENDSQVIDESRLIAEQNKNYLEMQANKRKREEQERRKQMQLQQIREEKKVRKMSIPEEPESGDGVIKVIFRCPNGDTIARNFEADEKCELLYHWVELNEEIQFEDETITPNQQVKFDLLHSYPPESLSSQKEKNLRDVFEGPIVKIVIKQR